MANFCSECGAKMENGRCPNCGYTEQPQAQQTQQQPRYQQYQQSQPLYQQYQHPSGQNQYQNGYQQSQQQFQDGYQQGYQQSQQQFQDGYQQGYQQAYQQFQQQQPQYQQPIIINNNNTNTNTNVNTSSSLGGVMYSPKSRGVAIVLCLLLGYLGIHRFYVGKIGTGVLYLFTCGFFFIGVLVDLISLLAGSFKDSRGLILR